MKKFIAVLLFLVGCAHSQAVVLGDNTTVILSTKGRILDKKMQGGAAAKCSVIQELNVEDVFPDHRKTGCWCMLPPARLEPTPEVVLMFALAPDKYCEEQK